MPYTREYKKSSGILFGLLLVAAVSAVYAVSPIISPARAAQGDIVGAWTLSGFADRSVRSVAVDPVYPHIVYAQVDDVAIYKSTDSGATWNANSSGLPQSGLSSGDTLTIDPLNTSILYVGSKRNGVYKSTDGGVTWFKSSTGIHAVMTIWHLAISHSDPNILFASGGYFSSNPTVENTYRSADGGASWKLIGTGGFITGTIVHAIALNPVDPTVVYLAAEGPLQREGGGIFKSVDGGASWSKVDRGGIRRNYDEVIIGHNNPGVIYAVYHGFGQAFFYYIEKSVDGGASWSAVRSGVLGRLHKLIIDPSDSSTIYVAGQYGVDKSTDGGVTWANTGKKDETLTLAIDSSGQHLYAGSQQLFTVTGRGLFSYHYSPPKPGAVPVPGSSPSPTPVLSGPNELVSINRAGNDSGNDASSTSVMTPDGRYVVFTSAATDLVAEKDANGLFATDVFVRDRQTGTPELVSINMAGTAGGNGFSGSPTISDDGRYVAFISRATDLVGNDATPNTDIFVRDRQTDTTELISVNRAGTTGGNNSSDEAAISSDGRYVVFLGYAPDLVPEIDANGNSNRDVFVRDRQTGTTRLVSVNSAGTGSGAGSSSNAIITPDGRYVAFLSNANDLVANVNDVNNNMDVFVRDMQTATTTLVSVNGAGTGSGNFGSGFGSGFSFNITPDGRYVAFQSNASDLAAAPLDANSHGDIYVRDLQAGKTTLVSINRAGTNAGNGMSFEPGITPDGRYIIFQSLAGDLVEMDAGNREDVFVRDLRTGTTELVSVNRAGMATGSGTSTITFTPAPPARITPDGRYVAFVSSAGDLTDERDTAGTNDVFIRDRESSVTRLVSVSNAAGMSGNGNSRLRQFSADGRYVLFSSLSDNLVAHDTNGLEDVFRYDAVRSSRLQLSAPAFQRNEDGEHALLTVTRTGYTSTAVSVDYHTTDTDTFTVSCSDTTNNHGGAYARCDFATSVGRLDFAAGEQQKTIVIPIIDDAHDEGAETFQVSLSNAAGVVLGATSTATVTIEDNDAASASNPIPTSRRFFVRQQYLDFLSREPDAPGFNNWLALLDECPNPNNAPGQPSNCDRIYVSGEGFFRSLEFGLKGSYVFRFYKVAFNRLPEYTEIVADMSFVAGSTPAEVYARKAQLAHLFTLRPEFRAAYDGLSNEAFVAALFGRYQLTQINTPDPSQPDGAVKVALTEGALAGRLDTGALARAQVLRAVADSDEVSGREFEPAFVAMQYYGYLRRKPEAEGYEAWLKVLRRGDTRTMVDGFLNSAEYKLRFGRL